MFLKKINFISVSLSLILSVILLSSSCQKAPINGRLDGMWEVNEVIVGNQIRLPERRVFYNFGMHVCALSLFGGNFTDGNMIYEGNTLALDFPYMQSQKDLTFLENYGIFSNPVVFTVEFISDEKLILYDGDTSVYLTKF